MYKFLIVFLLITISHTQAQSKFNNWKNLNSQQKLTLVTELKQFVYLYQKDMELDDQIKTTIFFNLLLETAHADVANLSELNCLYGGWPSKKATYGERVVCANPKTKNPAYSSMAGSKCSGSQLLCNPVLFGDELCVAGATSAERSSSFANCQAKFKTAGRTLEEVVAKIDATPKLQQQLEEILMVANKTCGIDGYQSRSGMCKTFMLKMAEIQNIKNNSDSQQNPITQPILNKQTPVTKNDVSIIQTEMTKVENVITQINTPKNNRPCYEAIQIPQDEEVNGIWEQSQKLDQSIATKKDHCAGNQNGSGIEKYYQTKHSNQDMGSNLKVTFIKDQKLNQVTGMDGFEISAEKYGRDTLYIEEGVEYPDMVMNPHRDFGYDGVNHKDAMFSIADWPIKEKYGANGKVIERYSSTDVKITNYMFFPRKVTPSIKVRDDKMYMTLTTGEKVVFDANTGKVLDGAFIETAANKTEVRAKEKRFYPDSNFSYRGEGIWLEAPITYNTDYRRAGSIIPIKSVVDGKSYKCDVKSEDLFESNWGNYMTQDQEGWLNSGWSCFRFKFETDQALYAFVKQKCPGFKMPYLAK